jgi:4-alpha-glucanotransferase
MTLHFYIKYKTNFGEQLFVQINHKDYAAPIAMSFFNEELWYVAVPWKAQDTPTNYNYLFIDKDGQTSEDWEQHRIIDTTQQKRQEWVFFDSWNFAGYAENAFDTVPFKNVLAVYNKKGARQNIKTATHIFKVKAPLLSSTESLGIIGSAKELGQWKEDEIMGMQRIGEWFVAYTDLSKDDFPVAYKYVIYNTKDKSYTYEDGNNRVVISDYSKNKVSVLHDGFLRIPRSFKGAGVAIPVFSLRSKESFGIGEFNDIMYLADWCKKVGLSLIQILPINDTTVNYTYTDSYPYSAISAFALHPAYMHLESLAGEKFVHLLKPYSKKKKQLNASDVVEYVDVIKYKRAILKDLYNVLKDETFGSDGYAIWIKQNAYWAKPYAAFCYNRDKYETADFNTWKTLAEYDEVQVDKLFSPKYKDFDEVVIHLFIQYHLHVQLQNAVAYAHQKGIVVKGDIPIGISRNSCDAWVQPELYNMSFQAGAPPDDFAVKGQNWGFPTYNWAKMKEDGFEWWRNRFEHMRNYFDAFRIDHILGFFRIWSIPTHAVEGILGFFVPAIPVHLNEFFENHIWFDYNRYCLPFISENVLNEYLGVHAAEVQQKYLTFKDGQWHLLPEYNTQEKVVAHFNTLPNNENNQKIKQGLFDLISNIILIEVTDSKRTQFHFRVGMEQTSSFKYLEYETQQKLKQLYVNYFYRRQDDFWKKEAWDKLPALKKTTNMLICGEDLGMVPECVPEVMQSMGLLSLEIQRMPKDPKRKFFHPSDAPYLSVVTPSTHDMSTIRGWWEEDYLLTQQFFNKELGQQGEAPFYCEAWINKQIVVQHLFSPAMWCIFQLQDWLGINNKIRRENPNDERINVPANPKHFWQYRMHLTLESLTKSTDFNTEVAALVKESGRAEG